MSETETSGVRRQHDGFVVLLEQLGQLQVVGVYSSREEAIQQADKQGTEHGTVFVVPLIYRVLR